jgi:circadian clock protein KaiC
VSPGSDAKLSTGTPGLDAMLNGGLSKGRVILVLGGPGTGKTILCAKFLHHGAKDKNETGVYIGMNEPQARFMGEMREIGMDFEDLEKKKLFSYVDATDVRRIPEQARVGRIPVGGKELGLVNLIDSVESAVEDFAPKRIVVDSISDLIFRFSALEERRPVVLDLVESLQSSGATCLMTSEVLSTGEERTVQPEEYLAEGVILLTAPKKGVRAIQILKMRGSNMDTHARPYTIGDDGLQVLATEEVY